MSGYGSISDYAFDKFNVDEIDDYDTFLKKLEKDFLNNGRSSLDKIFDQSDFNRLEDEFNELKEAQKEERVQTLGEIFSPVVGFFKGLFGL